jgi:beta-1,4-mannooligosaccharide/beta-1,4-mannosyl-N-acetylglucosamine phosphorylase
MAGIRIIGQNLGNIPFQERGAEDGGPVWRYKNNPVIGRHPLPGVARVFNSAVVPFKGEYIGVFRAEEETGIPYLRLGRSRDGIRFEIEEKRIALRGAGGNISPPEGTEYDPRVIFLEGKYYIIWCDTFRSHPTLGFAVTEDFQTFTRLEYPLLPCNRNGVLFPRRIGGEYALLSRPSDQGHTPFGSIFLSFSRDLEYWGRHRFVASPQPGALWQGLKIGAGAVPIETSEGWLLLYHGVSGTCNGWQYTMGGMLLDADDPSKVLYNCKYPLLSPEALYETMGFVPNVVFPCAALADAASGRIAIYYGAADTETCLAFTTVRETVDFIKKYSAV